MPLRDEHFLSLSLAPLQLSVGTSGCLENVDLIDIAIPGVATASVGLVVVKPPTEDVSLPLPPVSGV